MIIEELIRFQAECGRQDDHLVWIGEQRFTIAHTDEERAEGFDAIIDCPLNDWMESWGGPPEEPGKVYIAVPYEDDWELLSLDEGY